MYWPVQPYFGPFDLPFRHRCAAIASNTPARIRPLAEHAYAARAGFFRRKMLPQLASASKRAVSSRRGARSVLFDDQCHLGAGGHAVAGQFDVFGCDLVLFEGRVALFIDREHLGVDGVALRVPRASGLFETNLHGLAPLPRTPGWTRLIEL